MSWNPRTSVPIQLLQSPSPFPVLLVDGNRIGLEGEPQIHVNFLAPPFAVNIVNLVFDFLFIPPDSTLHCGNIFIKCVTSPSCSSLQHKPRTSGTCAFTRGPSKYPFIYYLLLLTPTLWQRRVFSSSLLQRVNTGRRVIPFFLWC